MSKPITREELEKRLAQLKAEQEQVMANLNAYAGAIAECQHWIDELDKEDE